MKIIGLSGGIAAGKNFAAQVLVNNFANNSAVIFDADREVHKLLKSNQTVILEIKKHFPKCYINNEIDRKILGQIVFANNAKLQVLEAIIHPKITENYQKFLKKAQNDGKKLIILNIPLLLEKNNYKCDKIITIIASPSIQKRRFLARARKNLGKNFTKEVNNLEKKFNQIKAKQLSNAERKKLADFIVNSNLSKAKTISQIIKIIPNLIS